MRNILLTIAIAIGASAVLYAVPTWLGLPAEMAKALAGLPALTLKSIYEFLEKNSARSDIKQAGPESLSTFEEFAIAPLVALAIGATMFAGLYPVSGGITGFMVGLCEAASGFSFRSHPELFVVALAVFSLPLKVLFSFYIGRWIGGRSPRYAITVAIGSFALGSCAAFFASIAFMSDDDFQVISKAEQKSMQAVWNVAAKALPDVLPLAIACVLGARSGRRRRFARYLEFILALLPSSTRQTIVDLARDEAARASRPVLEVSPKS